MVGYRKPLLLVLLLLVVAGLIVGIVFVVPKGEKDVKKEGKEKGDEKKEPAKPAETKPAPATPEGGDAAGETVSAQSLVPGSQQAKGGAAPKPGADHQADAPGLDLPAAKPFVGPVYVEKFLLPLKCNGKFHTALHGVNLFFTGVKGETSLSGTWLKHFGTDATKVKELVAANDGRVKELLDKLHKYGTDVKPPVPEVGKVGEANVEETLLLLPCNLAVLLHAVNNLKEFTSRWAAGKYFGKLAQGGAVDDDDDADADDDAEDEPPAAAAAPSGVAGAGAVPGVAPGVGGVAGTVPGVAPAVGAGASAPEGLDPRDWDASAGLAEKSKALSKPLHELVGLVAKHSPFGVPKSADNFKTALQWAFDFSNPHKPDGKVNTDFEEWKLNFEKWLLVRVKVLGDADKDVKELKEALDALVAKVETEDAKAAGAGVTPPGAGRRLVGEDVPKVPVNANTLQDKLHRLLETGFTAVHQLALLVASVVGEDDLGVKKPVQAVAAPQVGHVAGAVQPVQGTGAVPGAQVVPANHHHLPLCPHLLPVFWETLTDFLEAFKKGAALFLDKVDLKNQAQATQKQEALVQVVKLVHKLVGVVPKSSTFYKSLDDAESLYLASDLLTQALKLLQPFLNTWKNEKLGLSVPVVDPKTTSLARASAKVLATGDAASVGAKTAEGPGAGHQPLPNGVAVTHT